MHDTCDMTVTCKDLGRFTGKLHACNMHAKFSCMEHATSMHETCIGCNMNHT